MDLSLYQNEARKTAKYPKELRGEIYYLALGLSGEVGELCNIIKKIARDNINPDLEKIKDELGDILWYLSELARNFGLDLNDIAKNNLEKLRKRYGV